MCNILEFNNFKSLLMDKLINNWIKSIFTRKTTFKKRLKQISKTQRIWQN